VAGNIKADTLKPNALKITLNACSNKLLASDASGNASWLERSSVPFRYLIYKTKSFH
jgi:hypothetical protein